MDEHSPKYIAFMQKAKRLQALWVPGAGDWYTFLGADRAYLLDYPLDPRLGSVDDDVRWLPSLFQLIRIIEGAGWRVEQIMYELDKGTYYSGLDELMMRAAKLAARAVEMSDG